MKIALASDHGGYELKELIKKELILKGQEILDFGCDSLSSVDYPDYIQKAAQAVSQGLAERGIVFCGSGVGASIVANKIPGIRAVLGHNEYVAEYSRKHNDANVLALAGRLMTFDMALRCVEIWLATDFEGGRHQNRLDKITHLEKGFRERST